MSFDAHLLQRFHRALVAEIRHRRPELLEQPFPVASIYEDLVPYRTHRNVIGVAMNGDYEDALLRLLGGQGDFLVLESERALRDIRKELGSVNPDTSLYRQFAQTSVRLNPTALNRMDHERHDEAPASAGANGSAGGTEPVPVRSLAPSDPGEEPSDIADLAPTGRPEDDEWSAPAPSPHRIWSFEPEAADTPGPEAGAGETPEAEPEPDRAAEPVVEPAGAPIAARAAADAFDDDADHDSGAAAAGSAHPAPNACRWCAEPLPDREGLNYCPHCGGDVRLAPCPSCGEALEPDWRFCIACGNEVVAS